MLSVILSHANSNETSFAGLEDIAVLGHGLQDRLLAVDADTSLLDEQPRIATAFRKSGLDQRRREVRRIVCDELANLLRNLALAEFGLEVRLGACGRLLPMQAPDQLLGECRLRVAWLESESRLELSIGQPRDEPELFLSEWVGDGH